MFCDEMYSRKYVQYGSYYNHAASRANMALYQNEEYIHT